MSDTSNSRREFLTQSAKLAAISGLATAAVANAKNPLPSWLGAKSKIKVVAGPKPRTIGPNEPIRFGLIGVGGQCRHDLGRLLTIPNISIKAIADPDEGNVKKAVEVIEKNGGDKVDIYNGFDDWKNKLLAREDIDAILTATPCYMHGPIHLACFEAGKHFYGEKPLCTEADEADALVEAQRKNPEVKGQIGFQRRGSKLYAEGIKRIRDGVIGDPIDGRGAWNNAWGPIGLPKEVTGKGWMGRIWLGRAKYSGDWMLEQACHTWDVFCWITGKPPISACGFGRKDLFKDLDPDRDVTDYYIANLEFPDGFLVDFQHSWFCPKTDPKRDFSGVFEKVAGKKGGLILNEGLFLPREDKGKAEKYKTDEDHYLASMTAFVNSIREHTPVCCGVESSRLATYTGLLVRKAVNERRRVDLKEIGYKPM